MSRLNILPRTKQQAVRHRCRNPHCRLKLPAPVENEHHAFCTRGCYDSFHHNRCRVCEADLRKQGRRGDAGRLYCRPPNRGGYEARKWPHKYSYPSVPRPRAIQTPEVPILRGPKPASKLSPGIVCDGRYPDMYRLRLPDGSLSDMVNLTRAKDALAEMRRHPK